MERLVSIRGRELHHDVLSGRRKVAEFLVGSDFRKQLVPVQWREKDVQVSFHAVVAGDFGDIGLQPFADGIAGIFRRRVGNTQKREDDQCIVALELFLGNLDLKRCSIYVSSV